MFNILHTVQSDVKRAISHISCCISSSISYCYGCVSIHCESWLRIGQNAGQAHIVSECRRYPCYLFLQWVGLIWVRRRTVLGWWRSYIWSKNRKIVSFASSCRYLTRLLLKPWLDREQSLISFAHQSQWSGSCSSSVFQCHWFLSTWLGVCQQRKA